MSFDKPCHCGHFISPPDPDRGVTSSITRLAASMRRRIDQDWDAMPPAKRDRLYHAHGAALAVICGVPAREIGASSRRGSRGLQEILQEIHLPEA